MKPALLVLVATALVVTLPPPVLAASQKVPSPKLDIRTFSPGSRLINNHGPRNGSADFITMDGKNVVISVAPMYDLKIVRQDSRSGNTITLIDTFSGGKTGFTRSFTYGKSIKIVYITVFKEGDSLSVASQNSLVLEDAIIEAIDQ